MVGENIGCYVMNGFSEKMCFNHTIVGAIGIVVALMFVVFVVYKIRKIIAWGNKKAPVENLKEE